MRAIIEGRFGRACRLIEEAEVHASKIDEIEARITLALQRFAILTEWEAADTGELENITTRLGACFQGDMEEAEFFVTPFILSYTSGHDPGVARQLVSDASMINRAFATRDTYLVIRIAELGAAAGKTSIVERAIDDLHSHRDECASVGLLGSVWAGPVAFFLGRFAALLGRTGDAAAYLESALVTASNMGALPYVARAHLALAELEAARGNPGAAATHADAGTRLSERLKLRVVQGVPAASAPAPAKPAPQDLTMVEQGDVWKVSWRGMEAVVRGTKGLGMLAQLVQREGQEIHVLDLSGSDRAISAGDAGPALDPEARKQYRARIGDLEEQLEEARELGDVGQADSLQTELDFLTRELSRAFGVGGRERRPGSAAERARVNVRRRIKDAIERIAEQNAELGAYLENTVKTGSYCKYSPM